MLPSQLLFVSSNPSTAWQCQLVLIQISVENDCGGVGRLGEAERRGGGGVMSPRAQTGAHPPMTILMAYVVRRSTTAQKGNAKGSSQIFVSMDMLELVCPVIYTQQLINLLPYYTHF